jgi:mannose-6-phosphate isomerase-like protein (cupin superfamily)
MLAYVKQAKFLLILIGAIALASAAVAATYIMGCDTPPKPTYAIDSLSVPAKEIVHKDHTGLWARQVCDAMGIPNRAVSWEIHNYRPGGSLNKHMHTDSVHVFYILSGTADYHIGDQTYHVRPGTFIYCPENIPHSMEVTGNAELSYVWFSGPAPSRLAPR